MKFTVQRDDLQKTLQVISGAVERKQTMPILGNVLLQVRTHQLLLTTTDLEIEYQGQVVLSDPAEPGEITVSARKLIDICRTLPSESSVVFELKNHKLNIKSANSRFNLVTIEAEEFPRIEDTPGDWEFSIAKSALKKLIINTQFAMAQQDVRYYLNGLLLEIGVGKICAVATDGHRLAISEYQGAPTDQERRVIVPRKAVVELSRMLSNSEDQLALTLAANHLRIADKQVVLTTKLIDGRFPEYERVIPRNNDRIILVDRDVFHDTLARVSILSHEKNKGVKVQLREGTLRLTATNNDQEQAEEELTVAYNLGDLDMGFNAEYMLQVLGVIPPGEIKLAFADANSSLLISSVEDEDSLFVVMPMRL